MKLSGLSFDRIRDEIARNENDIISAASLWACIKRTAIGKSWKPISFEGRSRFLNLDEELASADWVRADVGGRTMQEFLQGVVHFRWRAIMEAKLILDAMGCPCIAQRLHDELCDKSRTWAHDILQKLNLKLVAPELLETKRPEYDATSLITRWFSDMSPEVQGADPCLIFNFDETMLYSASNTKIIITSECCIRHQKTFRRKTPMGPHITLGLCVSPIGGGHPPLIILPAKDIDPTFAYSQSVNLVHIVNSPSG
jgi:hypothetical protein